VGMSDLNKAAFSCSFDECVYCQIQHF